MKTNLLKGNHDGHDGGPPGQNLLCLSLALLAAVLGTPYLFGLVGPFIQKMVYDAYGSADFADLMYYASYILSAVAIFSIARMTLWYAITAIVTFGAMRFGGVLAPL